MKRLLAKRLVQLLAGPLVAVLFTLYTLVDYRFPSPPLRQTLVAAVCIGFVGSLFLIIRDWFAKRSPERKRRREMIAAHLLSQGRAPDRESALLAAEEAIENEPSEIEKIGLALHHWMQVIGMIVFAGMLLYLLYQKLKFT